MSEEYLQLAKDQSIRVTSAVFEMINWSPSSDFWDLPFSKEGKLSEFGHLLRGHANYCLINFSLAFKANKLDLIEKTACLLDILFFSSRKTLEQEEGLGLLPFEKAELRS